jgi:hypothetical protein
MKLVTALEAARDIRGLRPSVLYQRVNCMAAARDKDNAIR